MDVLIIACVVGTIYLWRQKERTWKHYAIAPVVGLLVAWFWPALLIMGAVALVAVGIYRGVMWLCQEGS